MRRLPVARLARSYADIPEGKFNLTFTSPHQVYRLSWLEYYAAMCGGSCVIVSPHISCALPALFQLRNVIASDNISGRLFTRTSR